MDIYLTVIATGSQIRVPMLPEAIVIEAATRFQSYDIMALGEIKLPLGEDLTGVSWSAKFPGEGRKNEPYCVAWQDPRELDSWLHAAKHQGSKLRLLITGTKIAWDMYVGTYKASYTGGYGDIDYDLTLTQAKDLTVSVEGTNVLKTLPRATSPKASAAAQTKSYTVKPGDTLWAIAQKYLGSGSKFMQIYNLNKNTIKNPNKIQVGWVLKLP